MTLSKYFGGNWAWLGRFLLPRYWLLIVNHVALFEVSIRGSELRYVPKVVKMWNQDRTFKQSLILSFLSSSHIQSLPTMLVILF